MLHTPDYIAKSVICLITILKGMGFYRENKFI